MGLEGIDELDAIKERLEKIREGIPTAAKEAIQESLDEGKDHSVSVVHVITGRLRDSIRTENVTEEGGDLVAGGGGTGVDYAAHEEYGNSKREGHPYLEPGFEITKREFTGKLKDKIDELLR